MKKYSPLVYLLLMLVSSSVSAQGIDWSSLYIGGGGGTATFKGSSNTFSAVQLLVGLPVTGIAESNHTALSIEAGYMDIGNSDRDGFWITPALTYYLGGNIELLARAGYEKGSKWGNQNNEDSGFTAAFGVGHRLGEAMTTRLEAVSRPEGDAVFISLICGR